MNSISDLFLCLGLIAAIIFSIMWQIEPVNKDIASTFQNHIRVTSLTK